MAGHRGLRGEDGANAVEFALVLPILLVMIFGMLTGGILLFQKLGIEQGNREAARWAATLPLEECNGGVPADPPADCWFEVVANRAVSGAGGELNESAAGRFICVAYVHHDGTDNHSKLMTWDDTAGATLTAANAASTSTSTDGCVDDGGMALDPPRVEVRTSRTGRLDLVFYGNDVTLESTSIARYEPEPKYS